MVSPEEGNWWEAVKIGPETAGWTGPNITVKHTTSMPAKITAFMGDEGFSLNLQELGLAWLGERDPSDKANVFDWMGYSKHFAVRVPIGSLDIDDRGNVEYSQKSTDILFVMLERLFSALPFEVQAELHKCETPVEVVRKYAELQAHSYPFQVGELQWRGLVLNDLVESTATMRVRVVDNYPMPERQNPYRTVGRGNIKALSRIADFGAFVSWQTRNAYVRVGFGPKIRATPNNVFLIRASSQEEYEEGQKLLEDEVLIWDVLKAKGRTSVRDASFFICPAGDPLEEWVDGEALTVKDIAEASLKQGFGHRSKRRS